MRIPSLFLLALPLAAQDAAPDGESLFALNCAACHLPDRQVVGPSLVEISALYAADLPAFLQWSKNPRKKRPGLIDMPSMAHLPDEQLARIHAHVLKTAEGLTEVKDIDGDPFLSSPTLVRRPNILRTFMPDAGPAAIAVAIDDTWSYCWDAGACRLRYIWKGGFIDPFPVFKGSGNDLARIQGTKVLTEATSPLAPFADSESTDRKFLGYSVKGGLPTFRYRIGDTTLTERIEVTEGNLTRSFTFSPPLPLGPLATALATADGPWTPSARTDGTLILSLKPR